MDLKPFFGRKVKIAVEVGPDFFYYTGVFSTDGTFVDKFGILFSFAPETIKRIEVVE